MGFQKKTLANWTEKRDEFPSMTLSRSGKLITFEGCEGSGKTTQIGLLSQRLMSFGHEVVVTREPGGTAVGESIRHLLKHDGENSNMSPEAELLLFAASRAQLVREVIQPALERGALILCDRYLDSTTVYQGIARNLSDDPVKVINEFAVGQFIPDITVVIDVPAELGLARVRQRPSDLPDRMEQENIEFYDAVREGYLLLARNLPERFIVVNGERAPEQVSQAIWEALQSRLPLGPLD
ncbi:MAG: dTMP kinase [Opitutales bacterium]